MAEISAAVLDRMANQYAMSLSRLAMAAEAATLDAWYAHNSFDSDDDPEWEATYWAILAAVSIAIEALVTQYSQLQADYLGIAPRLTVPDVTDILRSEFDRFGGSPPVRARYLISEGLSQPEAIGQSGPRVVKLTSTSTRMVEQAALADLLDQLSIETVWEFVDERPDEILTPRTSAEVATLADDLSGRYPMSKAGKGSLKWRRVPQGNACGWCQAQSSRLLTDETRDRDRGWHTFCRCGWRRVTAKEASTWEPMAPDQFARLTEQRYEGDE